MLKIRILGRSEAPTTEWRGNVFGTGNDITLKGDMARRSSKPIWMPRSSGPNCARLQSIPSRASRPTVAGTWRQR